MKTSVNIGPKLKRQLLRREKGVRSMHITLSTSWRGDPAALPGVRRIVHLFGCEYTCEIDIEVLREDLENGGDLSRALVSIDGGAPMGH